MFEIIAITNRRLCKGDFLSQIERLCRDERISAIVLREKDLSEDEYKALAKSVIRICAFYDKKLILHHFARAALELDFKNIHLSISDLEENKERLKYFELIGASIHSMQQLAKAESLSADYVFAGHIFATDCKKGLKPRTTEFLREAVYNFPRSVYAIGGINKHNLDKVRSAGAAGACIMSLAMQENIDI